MANWLVAGIFYSSLNTFFFPVLLFGSYRILEILRKLWYGRGTSVRLVVVVNMINSLIHLFHYSASLTDKNQHFFVWGMLIMDYVPIMFYWCSRKIGLQSSICMIIKHQKSDSDRCQCITVWLPGPRQHILTSKSSNPSRPTLFILQTCPKWKVVLNKCQGLGYTSSIMRGS